LRQSFGFAHFEGENLGTSEHGEGNVLSETFGHGHGDGCFASTGLSADEDGSASDFAFLDEFEDDSCGLPGFDLG
jgi:hypothetical protein